MIKSKGEGWSVEIPKIIDESENLANWLKKHLTFEQGNNREYAYLVRQIAHRVREESDKRHGGGS